MTRAGVIAYYATIADPADRVRAMALALATLCRPQDEADVADLLSRLDGRRQIEAATALEAHRPR